MKRTLLPLMVATALAIPQANAQTATTSTAANPPQKKDDSKKLICRTDDEIGTRVRKKRICLTREEWRQVNTESSMAIEKNTTQLAKPGGG